MLLVGVGCGTRVRPSPCHMSAACCCAGIRQTLMPHLLTPAVLPAVLPRCVLCCVSPRMHTSGRLAVQTLPHLPPSGQCTWLLSGADGSCTLEPSASACASSACCCVFQQPSGELLIVTDRRLAAAAAAAAAVLFPVLRSCCARGRCCATGAPRYVSTAAGYGR
jgi:hypothetical protein